MISRGSERSHQLPQSRPIAECDGAQTSAYHARTSISARARVERAHFVCVSDTVAVDDRVPKYGDSLRRGSKKCTSRRSGMVCRNLRSGHGFRLSRDDVDRF